MKVEYLNAFVQATLTTCSSMLGVETKHGKLAIKNQDVGSSSDITAVVGLSGKIRGSIVVGFDKAAAAAYVKKLLCMDGEISDAEICDGVGEMCNIIGGSAKVELNKFNLNLTISIPNVVVGKGIRIASNSSYPSLYVPFDSELGEFAVEVCLITK